MSYSGSHVTSQSSPRTSQVSESNRQKQSAVTIVGSSSPRPGLSSGSASMSISSVETSDMDGFHVVDGTKLPVITINGDSDGDGVEVSVSAAAVSSRASSHASSWSSVAPTSSVHSLESLSSPYACLFHMLDCHESFDEVAHWNTHVLAHFQKHPPPRMARCPLCPDTKFVDDDDGDSEDSDTYSRTSSPTDMPSLPPSHEDTRSIAATAWNRLLNHVATDHFQHGHTLAGSRTDFELMRYLYGCRIISDAQFKAMQLAPAPSSPAYHHSQDGVRASIGSADEPYCAPYSRRREERMRGQGGASVC
ncbi:hypothetical protein N7495_000381 [Penicillium taxi]|uniref:uncharacterized protein n=1 Tax=Penicillium taxi TaxID=168475 RepID=UPI002545AE09|nr:uncharacterized protein N7495_000381 [Penicillium taxi]KAJ5907699.1 hypothetical protein N7495_000381 [Penicillium taxi]